MTRVLLVQPSMQPPGGSNGVAAWVLQALASDYQVTVLSWQPVEIDAVNRFYGTHLAPTDFNAITVPRRWRAPLDRLPVPAALLKNALLMRYTREAGNGFDVIFGCFNETDFGRRGIQYVHYPTYLRPRPQIDLRWYHASGAMLGAYYALADRIAGFSMERLMSNITLVNSNWTGERVTGFLGVPTRTVYPPIVEPAPELPWASRRAAFLAVGRVAPEKQYERVMRILVRVRERHPITLTIVGTWDRHSRAYYKSLAALAASHGSWIEFRSDISRDELRALMASYRYGIHGMQDEHFGMAPAEMARAGMIVWVPRGGGQVEIVGGEPSLSYDSDDDAVSKIVRVLEDGAEQQRLRGHLSQVTRRFSAEDFMREIREIVAEVRR